MPAMRLGLPRSSVSAKILVGFLAILAVFSGVTAYTTLGMQRLGDEMRRLSRGYLTLRLEVQDLQTRQDNLLRVLERVGEEGERAPAFVKAAVDNGRIFRRSAMHKVRDLVDFLRREEPTAAEGTFLVLLDERLARLERIVTDDEPLFDEVYGPLRSRRVEVPAPERIEEAHGRLLRQEERLWRDLGDLSKVLRGRVQTAELQLEHDVERARYATLLLLGIAALLAVTVVVLVQRSIAPLARLASSAKQLARGDLKQRVEVTSADEIGALAGEFNAMAAALEERELRLIRSERLAAVGKIAAQITHEVRNPLSSIGLNAEMLLEELEGSADRWDSAEARELLVAIGREVDRLTEITEQYLRLARLPTPKLERESLNAIVSSLLAFVREELAGRGVAVEVALDPGLPAVQVDESQIRQALLNLVRNAMEAMPDGGRLTVTTASVEDGERPVEVSLRDTGPGIPEEVRGRIFDPFFSTKAKGTGLGLALAQQMIAEHGGAIEVESEPGQGTTFRVRLPASRVVDEGGAPTA